MANAAVAAIIREGATQKLQDVIISGKAQGMQFMDDAIWALLEKGIVSPHEAFMKAIDKNRFKPFLSAEEEALANAAGAAPDDEKRLPGNFIKPFGARPRAQAGVGIPFWQREDLRFVAGASKSKRERSTV